MSSEAVDDGEKGKGKVKPEEKYLRGPAAPLKGIQKKNLRNYLVKDEKKKKYAAKSAATAEILLTEESGFLVPEGMEKTYHLRQQDIVSNVDISSARKVFDLKFEQFGPYHLDYTRNGRHMIIGGKKGHIGTFDWQTGKLGCELHLKETVRDVSWLHNETMFAVAQKKFVYIYDLKGVELHCLKNHVEPQKLEFLPYHFLLASIGSAGFLKYQDTSTGQLVAELPTRLGLTDAMCQNPNNAIIHLGHSNGTVTYWSPNSQTPLVKILAHKGPVRSVAVDPTGNYMISAGADSIVKVWDVRTYKELNSYKAISPVNTIDISQKGLVALGLGPRVQVWKDMFKEEKQKKPYMTHLLPGSPVTEIRFCPFEDTLGIGHESGVSSILIPGSGEPNFDALEANPFQTVKQRKEAEVKKLLEKLQPEMISLDPSFIGTVSTDTKEEQMEKRKLEYEANHPGKKFEPKHRARGRSSTLNRFLRKRTNVVDQKREEIKAQLDKLKKEREKRERGEDSGEGSKDPLERFTKKRKV